MLLYDGGDIWVFSCAVDVAPLREHMLPIVHVYRSQS